MATKILTPLSLSLLILANPGIATTKICEIKYGEKDLGRQQTLNNLGLLMKNLPQQHCYKIGTEFNNLGKALINKPIYACCDSNRSWQ